MVIKMTKTKKIIIVVLSILLVVVGVVLAVLLYNNSKKDDLDDYIPLEENKVTFVKDYLEVYEDINLKDVIKLNDGLELVDDYKIDTDELGIIKLYIKFLEDGKEKKEYTSIEVKDTTPPYVGSGGTYSHIINTTFTFSKDILCADNYDKHIECEVVGDYDLTKIGQNYVKVRAEDSSGNVTEKDLILKVIERPKTGSSSGTTSYISLDDIKKNKAENAEIVIDVSKWQENINWKKVKEAGINYAMLRLGTQKAVDKESVVDAYFEQNIKNAQANGIKVGVYYYSYANDIEDAEEQAEWVIEKLKDYDLDLPVAFDWECFKYFNDFNISIHDLNEIGRTFLDKVKNAGYDTVNYGSKNYLEALWDIKEHKTWLAHYTSNTDYSKDYIMWQFTSSGRIPGINGNVDVNYYYVK